MTLRPGGFRVENKIGRGLPLGKVRGQSVVIRQVGEVEDERTDVDGEVEKSMLRFMISATLRVGGYIYRACLDPLRHAA